MDSAKQNLSKRINDFFLDLLGSLWYGISNILSGAILSILLSLIIFASNQLSIKLNLNNDIIDVISNIILKILNYLILVAFGATGVIKVIIENTRTVKKQIKEIKNENNDEGLFDPTPLPGKAAETTKKLQEAMLAVGEIESIDNDENSKFKNRKDIELE